MSSSHEPKQKQPRHTWLQDDRIVLCLLRTHFKLASRKPTTLIFSEVARRRLSSEGFKHDIRETALSTQLNEMKGAGPGHEIWTLLSDISRAQAEEYYAAQVVKIRIAAKRLGLSFEHEVPSTQSSKKKSRLPQEVRTAGTGSDSGSTVTRSSASIANQRPIDRLSEFFYKDVNAAASTTGNATGRRTSLLSPSPAATEVYVRDDETTALRRLLSSTPMPAALQMKTDKHGNTTRMHPVLLFRACDNPQSIRSRKYSNPFIKIETPPAFGTTEFRKIVRPHLEYDLSYRSPFISFWQYARKALRIIELEKCKDTSNELYFAIYAYDDIHEDAKARYGTSEIPYLARALFEKDVDSGLPDGYNGCGEWLAYGSVECDPIATLPCQEAIRLARTLRNMQLSAFDLAAELSDILKDVPDKWKQIVAFTVIQKYCPKKFPRHKTALFNTLMKIVYRGHVDKSKSSQNNQTWLHTQAEGERSQDADATQNAAVTREQSISQIVSYLNDIAGVTRALDADNGQDGNCFDNSQDDIRFNNNEADDDSDISEDDDDWDGIEEDLEKDLLKEFPFIAPKLKAGKQNIPRVLETVKNLKSIRMGSPKKHQSPMQSTASRKRKLNTPIVIEDDSDRERSSSGKEAVDRLKFRCLSVEE